MEFLPELLVWVRILNTKMHYHRKNYFQRWVSQSEKYAPTDYIYNRLAWRLSARPGILHLKSKYISYNSICLPVWVCESYIVHRLNGSEHLTSVLRQ